MSMPKMRIAATAIAPASNRRRSRGESAAMASGENDRSENDPSEEDPSENDFSDSFMTLSSAARAHLDAPLVCGAGVGSAGEIRVPAAAAQGLAEPVEARGIRSR